VLVFSICVVVGAAASVLPAKVYTATEILSVEPTAQQPTAQQASGIDMVNFLLPSMIVRIGSQTFHDQVLRSLDPAQQKAVVELSARNDLNSGVLYIDAVGKDAAADAAWSNAASLLVVLDYNTITSAVVVGTIQGAVVPTTPTSPQPVPLLLGSATLGIILGTAAVVLLARPRRIAVH
jgi:uncharacterized protein involved in exopolysaccharide biosynthesis